MIWSVSTFARSSGAAMPVILVNGSIFYSLHVSFAHAFRGVENGWHSSGRCSIGQFLKCEFQALRLELPQQKSFYVCGFVIDRFDLLAVLLGNRVCPLNNTHCNNNISARMLRWPGACLQSAGDSSNEVF